MERKRPGFLESLGKSIDDTYRDAKNDVQDGCKRICRGAKKIIGKENAEETDEITNTEDDVMMQVKKFLMSYLEDIAKPVGDEFSYATVLRWVKNNHVGNQFYMIKYINTKSKNTYLFVFFAKDDNLLCGKKYPMVCFISTNLPEDIEDLFNGKDVFIQKFE